MKEYKKLKKFMFTLQARLEKEPNLPITSDLVKNILVETNIDTKILGGPEELMKLLKIHPNFKELMLV